MIDSHLHNRDAWDAESPQRIRAHGARPVDESTIEKARSGRWEVILTPNQRVPLTWFDGVAGKRVLCLASGGGQQAPVLAAAGASVTSFDISRETTCEDELVATRDGLDIELVQGDMTDLTVLKLSVFDLVFHPVLQRLLQQCSSRMARMPPRARGRRAAPCGFHESCLFSVRSRLPGGRRASSGSISTAVFRTCRPASEQAEQRLDETCSA